MVEHSFGTPTCSRCGKGKPADWCWEASEHCPFGMTPRYVDVRDLWARVVALEKRVVTLEER